MSALAIRRLIAGPTDSSCRDTEWEHALMMVALAVVLVLPGDTFASPAYSTFDKLGLGEAFWALVFGGCGLMRLAALWINGRRPQTPIFRMVGAAVGFLSWMNLCIQTSIGSWNTLHSVPLGVGLFFVLTGSELRSFCRAGYDARYLR